MLLPYNRRLILFFSMVIFFTAGGISLAHDLHTPSHMREHGESMRDKMSGINGKVIEIGEEVIVIERNDGSELEFAISDNTYVYIYNKRASLSDIQIGDGVNLQVIQGSEKPEVVSSINIWSNGEHDEYDDQDNED